MPELLVFSASCTCKHHAHVVHQHTSMAAAAEQIKARGRARSVRILEPIDRSRPRKLELEQAMGGALRRFFVEHRAAIVEPLLDAYKVQAKAMDPEMEAALERLIMEMDLRPFEKLPADLRSFYEGMAKDGSYLAARQVRDEMPQEAFTSMLKLIPEKAVEMAKVSSAALVGKRILADGSIIDNPLAKWRIDEATRQLIRSQVSTALQEGWSNEELRNALMSDEGIAFGAARAMNVARTELADMDVSANQEIWRESGLDLEKLWLISEDPCELCQENAAQGQIPMDDEFVNGDPPVHPRCTCDITAVVIREGE